MFVSILTWMRRHRVALIASSVVIAFAATSYVVPRNFDNATDRYQIVDNHSIRVTYTESLPECFGYRLDVTETLSSIVIDVAEVPADGSGVVCDLVSGSKSTIVKTKMPIGQRSIVVKQ